MATDDSWRTSTFRQSMVAKIEEKVNKFPIPMMKNASDMENHVFMKANSKDEYLGFIARLLLHISQMSNRKPAMTPNVNSGVQQGMPDPIGALQTLARQGTGNNVNMGMQAPVQNPQNMVPQQAAVPNTNANLLQTLNQQPGQQMNIHNKMPGIGMMTGQSNCPPMNVNQINTMQNIQTNPMLVQMNQPNIGQRMGPQPGQQQPIVGTQINVSQMGSNQMQAMQNQIQNQMSGHQMSGPMNTGMQPGMPTQQPAPPQQQHINQLNQAQMAANQLTQAQLGHMQRKPVEMMNTGFPGPRNVAPNQFLQHSPSPSVPSPGGLGVSQSNQMVASPALVGSPNPQHIITSSQRSISMAPSPGSSLNTPASALGPTPSPLQDDQMSQAYKDKVRKLSKYIEPLRKLILKQTSEGNIEKVCKMKKLLEVLTNPSSCTKLDVLQKCEVALEKLDLKKFEASVVPTVHSTLKEHHFFTPLLDVVSTVLQSPVANHTLHRTFGPCMEALFGPEIKNSPPLKKQKTEEPASEIPDVLQGEIARLDQRFKVSLDPAQQHGSKCIQLICWLDDKHLPCVPPVLVIVPTDYPSIPPRCVLTSHEYATNYLEAVQQALEARLAKLPKRYSVSQLLDTWEMCVRQASAPKVCQQRKTAHPESVKTTTSSTIIAAAPSTTTVVSSTTNIGTAVNTIVTSSNAIANGNLMTMSS